MDEEAVLEVGPREPAAQRGSLRLASTGLERLSHWYDRLALVLAGAAMLGMVVSVALGVIFRYLLHDPLTWSNSLATTLFAWLTFLGGTMSVRRGNAPALLMLAERDYRGRALVKQLRLGVGLAIGIALAITGKNAVIAGMSQTSVDLTIPVGYLMLAIPVAGVGFALHYLAFMSESWHDVRSTFVQAVAVVALLVVYLALPDILPAEHAIVTLLVTMLATLLIGVPVALSLIAAVFFSLLTMYGEPLTIVPQNLYQGTNSFVLLAVPFFMLTGAIMAHGGMAQRLVDFAASILGRFRGGLLYASIGSSAVFADISGSAAADTAAIGSVMLPGMVKRGYDKPFATAALAASGTLGTLFPPSTATIIYAFTANVSVASMFLASFLPGFVMIISFAVVCFIVARKRSYPSEPSANGAVILHSLRRCIWALFAPIIIVGSILTGIVAPAEAGVVAIIYTAFVSVVVYRGYGAREFGESLQEGIIGSARVMFILTSALLLGYLLTILQVPQAISSWLPDVSSNKIVLLIVLNIIFIIIHGVLETSSSIVLMVPLVLPPLAAVGVDPIHLGIILLVNAALGLLTPPLGLLLYVAAPITGIRVETLARALAPFLLVICVDLLILIVFPGISTVLPNLLN